MGELGAMGQCTMLEPTTEAITNAMITIATNTTIMEDVLVSVVEWIAWRVKVGELGAILWRHVEVQAWETTYVILGIWVNMVLLLSLLLL